MARQYEETHPWITFKIDLGRFRPETWLLLGEAESKCEHIAGVPLAPDVARRLHEVYLSKGIHGTTSIEGNTLSEQEVLARVQGDLPLPPSREYLGREVDNILAAYNEILSDVVQGRPLELTSQRMKHFNALILKDLEVDEGVVPGEIRDYQVGVLRYRGAPPEDCEFLLERLCSWLAEFRVEDRSMTFALAIAKAVLAHLYIAWIHPFGDGNGRTARLIEYQLLVEAGIPSPAAHLLSDFYNKTRDSYYRELDRTSKPPYPIERFAHYALRGFVDELREQLEIIRAAQLAVTWENYVHECFRGMDTPARRRQRDIVLDLPSNGEPVPTSRLPFLSPRVAMAYAGKGQKTISRDINELRQMNLVRKVRGGIAANREIIQAFLPVRAENQP